MASNNSLALNAAFEEDDEETYKLLFSSSEGDSDDAENDMRDRLTTLAERFQQDVDDNPASQEYWKYLQIQAQQECGMEGMDNANGTNKPTRLSSSSSTSNNNNNNPSTTTTTLAAFDTDLGKQHLKATAALLQIDTQRALQVTMSALRSVEGVHNRSSSLLVGTTSLVQTTVRHFGSRRLARLSTITEALRLESDTDSHYRTSVKEGLLDPLDDTYQTSAPSQSPQNYNNNARGLFRLLLIVACQPEIPPTRAQLEPSKSLSTTTPHSLQEASSLLGSAQRNRSSDDQAWNVFCQQCTQERRLQLEQERTEAMEALLVLLYERIQGGVQRTDYAMILLAFSNQDFFASAKNHQRTCQLAGLICAECMGLWRVFLEASSGMDEASNGWASQHPMLLGVLTTGRTNQAERELESLRRMLLELASKIVDRSQKQLVVGGRKSALEELQVPAPEALALLSFGLLLCLAHDSILASDVGHDTQAYWRTFQTNGTAMAQIANDKCGAFDYLFQVMESLADETSTNRKRDNQDDNDDDQPYDWQFSSSLAKPLRLGDGPDNESSSGGSGAYTSIAREILIAAIAAFENILSIHHVAACDNIGVLCNLAAAIYRNNSLICETFWSDWNAYISSNPPATPSPVCNLMDSAHSLAVAAMNAFNENRLPPESLLPAIAPFFRLLSSLCYNSNNVEVTIKVLPAGLLRKALLYCRLASSQTNPDMTAYHKCRVTVLESISTLARIGNSPSCREQLRLLLEEYSTGQVLVDGPRVLSRILSATDETDVAKHVLSLTSNLLEGAPQRWSLQLARLFVTSPEAGLARLLAQGDASTHSAALVLSGLMDHLTTVVFCDSFSPSDGVAFLHGVATGVLAAATTLAASLSSATASLAGRVPLSLDAAHTIISAFSRLLQMIRTVIELHKAEQVRTAAMEVRDALINALATSTGLGQAIAYYATVPVSLTLTIQLQDFMDNSSILHLVSNEDDEDDENVDRNKKYGAWHSVASKKIGSSRGDLLSKAKEFLTDSVSNVSKLDLNLEGIQLRGWTYGGSEDAPLRAASAAIRLLSLWAMHVEDIVDTHVGSLKTQSLPLEGPARDALIALSPQGLLSSLAASPLPMRSSSSLTSTWTSAKLSNFDLLLPYLSANGSYPTGSTLDLVHACLVHVQCVSPKEQVADSMLYRTLYRSSQFGPLVVDSITNAISLSDRSDKSGADKTDIANGLWSLRVLGTCARASPTIAEALIFVDGSATILPTLTEPIAKILDLLDSSQNDYNNSFLQDEVCITQLRVATGCLSVLLSLWTTARTAPNGSEASRLVEVINSETAVLKDLISIVAGHATAVDLELADAPCQDFIRGRSALLTFMSIAMNILSTEMASCLCGTNSGDKMMQMLDSVFAKDFTQLAPMSRHFAAFDSFAMVAKESHFFSTYAKGSKSLANISPPSLLLKSFPSTSVNSLVRDFSVHENAFDVTSAARWLGVVLGEGDEEMDTLMGNLSASHQLVSCELQSLSSWARFAEVLPFFYEQKGSRSRGPSPDRLLQLSRETLAVLHANSVSVEVAQVEISEDFLREETAEMASSLSGLLLFFVDMGTRSDSGTARGLGVDDLLEMLALLTGTSEKLYEVVLLRSASVAPNDTQIQNCCFIQQPLLASAIAITGAIESRPEELSSRRLQDSTYNDLARISSKVLRVLGFLASSGPSAADPSKKRQYREALLTCTSLLTVLIARAKDTKSDETLEIYYARISETFRDYEVLDSLLWQASSASTVAADLRASKAGSSSKNRELEEEEISVLKAVLTLLNKFADVGDIQLLTLLASSRLTQIVSNNPLFAHASNSWDSSGSSATPRRGYIPSSSRNNSQSTEASGSASAVSFYAGRDDPVHDIWLISMKILKASLRSAARQNATETSKSIKPYMFAMAIEFLGSYREQLLACLKDCSRVLQGSNATVLSLNALREASHILAVVAELCARPNRDTFIRASQGLYEEFVHWSIFVVVSISKFMGATGTSRELFLALAEYDSSGNDPVQSPTANKPRHALLAGGVPNAKHEAIRYSHFASRCCACVTMKDFENSSIVPSHFKHLSEDRTHDPKLERNCRLAVTSTFVLQLEQAAAECLQQAISIIWKTHPASSSFVMFDEEEVALLDAMPLVTPGMIIGIRPPSRRGFAADEDELEDSEQIRFGRVVERDTVNRTWRVKMLSQGTREEVSEEQPVVVPISQLAGIEDLAKRKCVAAYMPAPDTATQLENAGRSLTLGHLILVLRWCNQKSVMMRGSELEDKKFIQLIAEQVSALLGAELSIHDEVGSPINMPKADRARLDAQILELFGDKSEGQISLNGAPDEDGRLKTILGQSTWEAIQPQIQRETERARKDIEEKERKRNEKRGVAFEGAWSYGGIRRSGYKSPFRGLG